MECSCIDMDIDYDCSAEVLADLTVTARKEHQCSECGRAIKYGEEYRNETLKGDGRIVRFKTCLDCLSLRQEVFCSFYYGCLWADLEDELHQSNGQLSESCIAALTSEARDRVCDLIEKYW